MSKVPQTQWHYKKATKGQKRLTGFGFSKSQVSIQSRPISSSRHLKNEVSINDDVGNVHIHQESVEVEIPPMTRSPIATASEHNNQVEEVSEMNFEEIWEEDLKEMVYPARTDKEWS